VSNVRLLCHAHNQLAAEKTFGAGFMDKKRDEARNGAGHRREIAVAELPQSTGESRVQAAAATAAVAAMVAARERAEEIAPYLRSLGFRAAEVREAIDHCTTLNGIPLEDRVKAAIRFRRPKKTQVPWPSSA
jgi:hypothetical protein